MDTNWKNDESRQKIVNKIMDTLQRHMPLTGPDGMNELRKIALRFEEKIYTVALNQQDYLRKISLKMLTLESKANGPSGNHFSGSSPGNNQRPQDPGNIILTPQLRNQPQPPGNSLPLPGQPQPQQPMLQQNLQNSISAGGMPSSAGLAPSLSSIPNGLPTMQGISHSSINSSTGQVLPSLLANNQRQLQSRQQQHQHQLYQHQLQQVQQQKQAILKQKFQQQSQIQPSILQQQQSTLPQGQLQPSQQSILQPTQQPALQSTQQSILQQSQPSILQPAQQSALQSTQQSAAQQASQSSLQQHQQSILRQQQSQQSVIQQQQQSSLVQQSILQPQQQHQQLLGQQNMQQQQQQHQIQQLLQSKHQQTHQTSSSLLQSQSQQLQQQSQQQQLLSQLQSQTQSLQQQQPLLQQSNPIQQELQRLQTTGGLLQQQQQSSIEQQKQLLQQRGPSEASSTSMESSGQTGQPTVADCQEQVYQRLQNLKDMYYLEIKELYGKLTVKCQQPMATDQAEKLKQYKTALQRMMQYFQVSKSSIPPGFKDKVDAFEKQIQAILNSFKQRKPAPQQQQQGQQQLQSQTNNQVQSMQQQEKHVNPLQQMNLQPSVTSMQPNTVTPIQHSSMPLLQQSGVQTPHQNIRTTMQSAANLSSSQGTGVVTLQQSSVNHLQHNNNVTSLQQNNAPLQQNSISSLQQSGINPLQQNNINVLQQHHHQKQQEIMQAQQLKKQQHWQFQQHLLQQQQQQQQQQQLQQQQQQLQQQQMQQKHQQAAQMQAQLQAQQMPQIQQITELSNESKTKQSAVKQAFLRQHHQLHQCSVYQQQQQLKVGSALSVSSPQLHPAASPQVSQQSSPHIDQQSIVASSLQVPKVVTPMQPATSPFMAPSPSALLAPSPHIEDTDKQSSAISSISNAGSAQGFQQTAPALNHAQSLAIGTPGISTSPLLADFSPSPAQNTINQDGHQTVSSGLLTGDKSSTTEPPLERLIKVINSISSKALRSAVNDIGSVVSVIDRMAGSAPGNGSRAAVGEDLVAMTKCRLQARNLMSQDGSAATKRMRRRMSSMPLGTASSGGSVNNSLQQHNNLESPEMESTATSKIKRPRLKLQYLKEMYYPWINKLFIKISMKCQQSTAPDHIDKLRHYKNTLQRVMAYFEVPKSRIPPGFKEDKVDDFEKHIQAILNAFEQRKVASHEQ